MARAQYQGRGAQSSGLPAAPSGQSQTAKKERRDRCYFDSYGKKEQQATAALTLKRLSLDWKATVASGAVSRGGLTRGDPRACDHDLG